ncbi:MAG: hypothetical protein AAB071_00830 [Bacteroidota bacterium]
MKKFTVLIAAVFAVSSFAMSQMKPSQMFSFAENTRINKLETYATYSPKKTMKEHIHASVSFQLGLFSSSVPQFDSVFSSSSGYFYGLSADFNVLQSLNVEIKYRTFSKEASKTFESIDGAGVSTKDVVKAGWDQSWVLIGPKYFFKPNGNVYPYVGAAFGYFGANLSYDKTTTTDDGINPPVKTPYLTKNKTYNTYFGFAFEGGIRYILPDEGLAFFVNGEISLATAPKFRFDDNSTAKLVDVNIGGIGFMTGFTYIL